MQTVFSIVLLLELLIPLQVLLLVPGRVLAPVSLLGWPGGSCLVLNVLRDQQLASFGLERS